ncbi:MAG: DegV family protein [Lachnospiraceae bacterium]|nr:DegV family protein [Lachnospiraceae bacterium]
MKNIAIVTDSNSGITQQEAKELGIYVIPMPFYINGEVFFEDINLTQEEFYQHLADGAEISTSMPAVGDVTDLWDSLLKEYDEIVHIPMSSGLSSTCSTAMMLAEDYGGRVIVVDNKRISVTQKQAALDAKRMAALGWDAARIRAKLLETMYDASIYITLDTLYYLKKGGRVTPAVAAVGTLLRIKPVLQIQGDKLDSFANGRTKKAARTIMLDALRQDIRERFGAEEKMEDVQIAMAYTGGYSEEVQAWRRELEAAFPENAPEMLADPLSLSVSCHIGPGAIGYGCMKKLKFQ